MKFTIYTLTILSILLYSNSTYSQCELNTFASKTTITCGDCVQLSAIGHGNGAVAFSEDFNSGSPTGWSFTQTVTISNNTCGVPSPDNTDFMWMGDASINPRDMETVPFDLTQGGVVCFEMRYSIQGDASPCEGPDEPTEGVYLQYSTDGGATWITIEYWDPNGGNDPQLTNWNTYCVTLPPGAQTANTKIRWHQNNVSGAEYDHWGIDNIAITLNDPNYEIHWVHDNYAYGMGNGGGDNPTLVCPETTTTYTAIITDGTHTCTSDITINVVPPVFISSITPADTAICPGDCVTPNVTAYKQVSPEQHPSYSNQEISIVAGSSASMNINVQGMNNPTVSSNTVEKICLNSFNFSGTSICSSFSGCDCNGQHINPGQTCSLDVSSFTLTVTAPGGCTIVLVPSGVASGGAYNNVCFVPQGGASINTPPFPSAGNYQSQDSFDGLNGCDANGVWTMKLDAGAPLGFGFGALNGWSIYFNDPEIREDVNFTWSPTTDMTNSNTLQPTVCPTQDGTYTLTMSDIHDCATHSESFSIQIKNDCCNLHIDQTTTSNVTCGNNDGQITITVSGQTTNVLYSIDNGSNFQSNNVFSGLATGTYHVVVKDDSDCPVYADVVVSSDNAPIIDSVSVIDATCDNNNGSITIHANGGTGSLTYSIDNNNFQASNSFTNITPANLSVYVKDANDCIATQAITVNQGQVPTFTYTKDDAHCGLDNGSIQITATGGTGSYTYYLDNVSQGNTSSYSNLAGGSYSVKIVDDLNCEHQENININSSGTTSIDSVIVTNPSCSNACDGQMTAVVTGGTQPYTYHWFDAGHNPIGINSPILSDICQTNYTLEVTDASDSSCATTYTATMIIPDSIAVLNTSTTDDFCGKNEGALVFSATGGTAPLTYSLDGSNYQSSGTFTNLAGGNHTVSVKDASGCNTTLQANVTGGSSPSITFDIQKANCGTNDGKITVQTTGGSSPYQYTLNGGTAQSSNIFDNLSAGNYVVSVVDDKGCSSTEQVIVSSSQEPNIQINGNHPICEGESITLTATGGTSYTWSTGQTTSSITITPTTSQNTISVSGTDADGCVGTASVNLNISSIPLASFTAEPDSGDAPLIVVFTNTSLNATNYSWNFGDGQTSNSSDAEISNTYNTQGDYQVILTANNQGCKDTASLTIHVLGAPDVEIYPPNVFSPNEDGSNDRFNIKTVNAKAVHVEIFNRWGILMATLEDDTQTWDGKGASDGTYFYKYKITDLNDKVHEGHGFFHLVR